MRPRASVIIPVYNRAHAVLPTLQSVRDQTMADFECIVVDDGSDDGEELRTLVESHLDNRFRYIRRENGGGGAARNTGIAEAKGEFVAFLDSDDRWLPEKLEQDSDAARPGLVLFAPVIMSRNGRDYAVRPKRPPHEKELIGDYLIRHQGWLPTSTLVIPANVGSRYSEQTGFGQDADFALKLAHEGYQFMMHSAPLAIVDDTEGAARVSRSREWEAVLSWLEGARPLLSDRAYLAYRGWHVARMAAEAGQYRRALGFYATALRCRAFPPALAAKALAQIVIRRSVYARFKR